MLRNIQPLHGDMSGLPVWVRTPANLGHVGRAAGVGEARPFRGGYIVCHPVQ